MKSTYNLDDFQEGKRWEIIFSLLSMDRMEPFFIEMEFPIDDFSELREIARYFIVEYDNRGLHSVFIPKVESLLEETFNRIMSSLGTEALDSFVYWSNTIYSLPTEGRFEQQRRLSVWSKLFFLLRGQKVYGHEATDLNIPVEKRESIVSILNAVPDISTIKSSIKEMEITEWDKKIYNRFSEDEGADPMLEVTSQLRFHFTTKALTEIEGKLNNEEKIEFIKWAKLNAQIIDPAQAKHYPIEGFEKPLPKLI